MHKPSVGVAPEGLPFILLAAFTTLVFAILGLNQVPNMPGGVNYILVFGIIVSIGMSLGGLTGYAINPARDLGPRLAHTVLPIRGKGSSNWDYAIVPLIGPMVGGLIAVCLYNILPWAN